MTLTASQASALRVIIDAVLSAVTAAGPSGAPGGVIYSALIGHGASFNQYTSLMHGLVSAGKLTREGDCYFIA